MGTGLPSFPMAVCLHGLLPAQPAPALLAHVLDRKFPHIEEQSESPSIQLLEKKKEAKIMHHAMLHKKEVGDWGRGAGTTGTALHFVVGFG